MVEVCEQTKTKNQMLDQSIEQYKEVYIKARREFDKVINVRLALIFLVSCADVRSVKSVGRHIGDDVPPPAGPGPGGPGRGNGGGGGGPGGGAYCADSESGFR